ncbi:CPS_collapsed_G0017010.mRNA.1.CDS.1 [Saccharomyces cerevisiae]|nr:CPS_collapsed_G0017010.mRNA.1.CDS.1 [Saccharomyces cerevisiae]
MLFRYPICEDNSPTVWVVLAIRSEVEAGKRRAEEVNSSMEGNCFDYISLAFGPVDLNLWPEKRSMTDGAGAHYGASGGQSGEAANLDVRAER